MGDGFLGSGWRFELSDDPSKTGVGLEANQLGKIAEASDEELIRQSIWLILSTAPGERVMRPDFGCGIHDLVFSTPGPGAMGDITREVKRALTLWEPRVDLRLVTARADANDPARIIVEIEAEVRATNSRMNLVYPFYVS